MHPQTVPEAKTLLVTPKVLQMDQYCVDGVQIFIEVEGEWKRKAKFCTMTNYRKVVSFFYF